MKIKRYKVYFAVNVTYTESNLSQFGSQLPFLDFMFNFAGS